MLYAANLVPRLTQIEKDLSNIANVRNDLKIALQNLEIQTAENVKMRNSLSRMELLVQQLSTASVPPQPPIAPLPPENTDLEFIETMPSATNNVVPHNIPLSSNVPALSQEAKLFEGYSFLLDR